jgi:hypothetical protein
MNNFLQVAMEVIYDFAGWGILLAGCVALIVVLNRAETTFWKSPKEKTLKDD